MSTISQEMYDENLEDPNFNRPWDEVLLLQDLERKVYEANQYPSDDFLSGDYQTELANVVKDANKILFIPFSHHKLYAATFILKCYSCTDEKDPARKIYFLVSSEKLMEPVVSFLRRHTIFNVTGVAKDISDKRNWDNTVSDSHIVVIPSSLYLYALNKWFTEPSNARLIMCDDCVYGTGGHSLKQVMNFSNTFNVAELPRIVGLTSCLINPSVSPDNVYEFLKELEVTFKGAVVSSQYCGVTRRLMSCPKVKFVKFHATNKSCDFTEFADLHLETLIGKSASIMEKLRGCDVGNADGNVLWRKLYAMLHDVLWFTDNYGNYSAYVIASLHHITLEKLKLLNDSSSVIISAVSSDFRCIKALLYEQMEMYDSLENSKTVIKNSEEKIVRLISLLHKLGFNKCIVFVQKYTVARVLTYILQKLCICESNMKHILADLVMRNESVYEANTPRERCFYKKNEKAVLKRFHKGLLNTLVVTWDADIQSDLLNANWMIYFDMPADFKAYADTRRFVSYDDNTNFFFIRVSANEANLQHGKSSLENYVELDAAFKEVVMRKDINNVGNASKITKGGKSEVEMEEKFPPLITPTNKKVGLSTSVSFINKLCNHLPGDAFSRTVPRWKTYKTDDGFGCKLWLPTQSGVKKIFECPPMRNTRYLKKIVALEAAKFLYKNEYTNDNLEFDIRESASAKNKELFPNWVDEDDEMKAGSSECCRVVPIKFPEWLLDCAPEPMTDCYLHVIHLNPVYKEPDASRKQFFYNLMKSNEEFAIISSKKLPNVCKFPIYTDLGAVHAEIEVNASTLRLTRDEINKLYECHRFIFLDVLQVVKRFLVNDSMGQETGYCVVPVICSGNSASIAWDVVNNQSFKCATHERIDEERINGDHSPETYLGKVIIPWYRPTPKMYIVTHVSTELTPDSPFPKDYHNSYAHYYLEKYSLEVKQPSQPLLETRVITSNYNCVRPRAQKPGVKRKKGEKEVDYEEVLIPEFCTKQAFPAVYWYKATTLLAVTHRLHYLLVAEEIRRRVAAGTIGMNKNSVEDSEEPILVPDEVCVQEMEGITKPVISISTVLKDVKQARRYRSSPWGDEQLPIDVERYTDSVRLLELVAHCDFITSPTVNKAGPVFYEDAILQHVPFPVLSFLQLNRELSPGPSQKDILETLTLKECEDIVNLERSKMLGKAFLKFSVALWLYRLYPDLNLLQLVNLKRKLSGSRNLYYCGSKLGLASYVKLQDFFENNDWFISGFGVSALISNILNNSSIPPQVIFDLETPRDEQLSGVISSETRNTLQERMLQYCNKVCEEVKDSSPEKSISSRVSSANNHAIVHFKKQSVPDKTVAGVLQALTGVYLKGTGVRSTFEFLEYVGVLKKNVSIEEFMQADSKIAEANADYKMLNDKLNYRFRSTRLLKEAFTHHSRFAESLENCNHKLAFLGETILDFLITGYVFEHGSHLRISECKDLRTSLTNDVVFSAVAVRLGLHKYLSINSVSLIEKIDKFVNQQESVDNEISNEELLFLVEETNSYVTDSVDVPKALADVFKAVFATLFLDCGGDFKTTWHVCYHAMKNEIDKFSQSVPMNPVNLLHETDLKIEYNSTPEMYKTPVDMVAVPMSVTIDETTKTYLGIGSTVKQAKRIAAKLALKDLSKEFTL